MARPEQPIRAENLGIVAKEKGKRQPIQATRKGERRIWVIETDDMAVVSDEGP